MSRRIASSVCVLVSGGLDSGVMLKRLAEKYRRVVPVYIRSHLIWEPVEIFWLRKFLRALGKKNIKPLRLLEFPTDDLYGRHWSVTGKKVPGRGAALTSNYLPGRNLLLLSKAAIFCAIEKIPTVALGTLRDNPFSDAQPPFLRALSRASQLALRSPLRVLTPLSRMSKAQVIAAGRDLPLEKTFSCARPVGNLHCGRCTKCEERQRGFRKAGITDRTSYAGGEMS